MLMINTKKTLLTSKNVNYLLVPTDSFILLKELGFIIGYPNTTQI